MSPAFIQESLSQIVRRLSRHPVLARLAVALGLFVLRFHRELDPQLFLSWRDATRLYLPMRAFLASELKQGRLPTWFPYDGVGISFLGSAVGGVLDPLQVVVVLFSADQALKLQSLLLIAVGGAGAWLLARELAATEAARWLCALTFSLSGYLVSITDNFPYLQSAALLPWTVWCAERLRRSPRAPRAAAAGLAIALVLWGGDVQGALGQSVLLCALVLTPAGNRLRRLPALALSGAFIVAWTAPLLGAVTATAIESGRTAGVDARIIYQWPLHPFRLPELIIGPVYPPQLLKALGPDAAVIGKILGRSGLWSYSEMIGVIPCALAVLGARQCKRFVTLGVTALWLALGKWGLLYPVLVRVVPLASSFRYPEKLMPYVVLALSTLAALGLDVVRASPRRARWTLGLAGAAVLVLGLMARRAVSGLVAPGVSSVGLEAITSGLQIQSLLSMGVVAIGMAYVVWWPRRAAWVLVALAAGHSGWIGRNLVSLANREAIRQPSPIRDALVGAVHADRTRICSWPRVIKIRGPASLTPPEVLMLADRAALSPDYGALEDVGNIKSYAPGLDANLEQACSAEPHCATGCARRMGAGWFVASDDPIKPFKDISVLDEARRYENPRLVVYRDTGARALVSAPAVRHLGSVEDVIHHIQEDHTAEASVAFVAGPGEDGPSAGRVLSSVRPTPDRIEAEVEFDRAGLALVAEQCSLGWSARVDDRAAALGRADAALCTVEVPPGRHHLALRYLPPGWPWAFGPYGLAWVTALGLAGARLRRNVPESARVTPRDG